MSSINEIFLQDKLNGGEVESTFTVAAGVASAKSDADDVSKDDIVRVVADVDCHIAFGPQASVVATTADAYLPANTVEYFSVGEGTGIAVIRASTNGTLFVSVMKPVVNPRRDPSGTGYGERG